LLQKKLPRYPRLPATLLGRLARDERFPGTGHLLLMDALARAHRQSAQVASLAVVAPPAMYRFAAFVAILTARADNGSVQHVPDSPAAFTRTQIAAIGNEVPDWRSYEPPLMPAIVARGARP
jgi:hypothetical protein